MALILAAAAMSRLTIRANDRNKAKGRWIGATALPLVGAAVLGFWLLASGHLHDPRAHARHDPRGFGHRAGLAPRDLNADRHAPLDQRLGAHGRTGGWARRHHLGRGDHLADHQPCPVPRHRTAERQVGDPGHRGQEDRGVQQRVAKADGVGRHGLS